MGKKMALGKGIASLLQDTPNKILRDSLSDTDVVSSKDMIGENDTQINQGVSLLQLDELVANAQQPRKIFKQEELQELAESIKENGIIQPIIVGPVEGGRYEIIAGERRYRAAKLANLDKVPVVVKRITKKEKMVFSIIENVQRDDLNCVEEALAYLQLISEFKLTQDEVAKKVGKSRSSIANLLRILKLPRPVIELLQSNKLSLGHAKVLISLKGELEKIISLANKVIENHLSVRELERLIELDRVRENVSHTSSRLDTDYEKKIQGLQDLLIDLTGRKLSIKSRGNSNKGSIEFKFSNKAEFNSLFDYLTLSSNNTNDQEGESLH